jgi:AcrR family transcriptional regulator
MTRKKEILDAALKSCDAGGQTTIEEVRRSSGASVGSIYHHFGGKDGIAAALYLEILRGYQAGVVRALNRAASAEEGVEALVRHHLRWVERNPERARFLLQGGVLRKAVSAELGEINRDLSAVIAAWVEPRAEIRPLPREVFYAAVIGPAQEVSRLWLGERIRSLRALEKELATAAWRAVKADR